MRSVISETHINTGLEKFEKIQEVIKKVIKILFVCHGNIRRISEKSVFCKHVLQKRLFPPDANSISSPRQS